MSINRITINLITAFLQTDVACPLADCYRSQGCLLSHVGMHGSTRIISLNYHCHMSARRLLSHVRPQWAVTCPLAVKCHMSARSVLSHVRSQWAATCALAVSRDWNTLILLKLNFQQLTLQNSQLGFAWDNSNFLSKDVSCRRHDRPGHVGFCPCSPCETQEYEPHCSVCCTHDLRY